MGLRRLLWRIKLRLQWTGWLQYFIPLFFGCLLTVAGLLSLTFKSAQVPSVLLGAAGVCWLRFLFEMAVIKYKVVKLPDSKPKPRHDLDTFDLMRERHSCRSFQDVSLSEQHMHEIREAVRKETQPECFLGGAPIRLEFIEAPLIVWPVVNARQFLIAIGPKVYNRIAVINVGRCMQKVVMHATGMGLGTCWIGPGADHNSVITSLGDRFDPERDHIICTCAVGYESRYWPLSIRTLSRIMHQLRLPLSALFFEGPQFQKPLDLGEPLFRKFGRCYEICQYAPSSYNEQPTRCAAAVVRGSDRSKLAHLRFDFGVSTNSRYYVVVALGIWLANWELGVQALGHEGHFQFLSEEERKATEMPELPRYDVSWVCDKVAEVEQAYTPPVPHARELN